MDKLRELVQDQLRNDLPKFKAGDKIKVYVRVIEGGKERVQAFEGNVISIKGSGVGRTFTVRKISSGVGVERIFPYNSPKIQKIEVSKIQKIEVLREGKVRRAKLYYLRGLSGKAARIKNKNFR